MSSCSLQAIGDEFRDDKGKNDLALARPCARLKWASEQTNYFYDGESGCKYEEPVDYAPVVTEAVRFLHDRVFCDDDKDVTSSRVLEEVAASGQASVVEFADQSLCHRGGGEFMDPTADRSRKNYRALSLAISGGHVDVVEVLLGGGAPYWVWDSKDVFEQALKEGQEDVAWSIYKVFRDSISSCEDADLIVQMVRDGRFQAVKSLYKTDFGIERIGDALIAAVQAGRLQILEFLYDTRRIPPKTIVWALRKQLSTDSSRP
ncbi:hypothetical protein ON010_g16018 [Phytophthora cinnamomi]|nr:hypothetical protein ON010_g16018 [Phytophthora cinnamomi]